MAICEHCGMAYTQRMRTQRFCNSVCSQEFFTAERRLAVQTLRAETSTYHSIAEADADALGGRWARHEPKVEWHDQPGPNWADQGVGPEPPINETGNSPVLGFAIDDR